MGNDLTWDRRKPRTGISRRIEPVMPTVQAVATDRCNTLFRSTSLYPPSKARKKQETCARTRAI